jgi:predicted nucleic acid-binding protein
MFEHQTNETFIGAPTLGELEAGIELLSASPKRRELEHFLRRLIADFEDRILPFEIAPARIWCRAVAVARHHGRTLPVIDSQLAAIASANGLAVVTRNARHFDTTAFPDLQVINPWSR